MNNIPTPHIGASSKDEIAKVVLMPGDPLRAKMIAETCLQDSKLFNQVRGMFGYTGMYRGRRVSVMGSGMGLGSIGIYSYELYKFYEVETIIRVGSCGAIRPGLNLMDILLVDHAFSTDNFAKEAHGYTEQLMQGSQRIAQIVRGQAEKEKTRILEGNIASGNVFYSTVEDSAWEDKVNANNLLAVEMESFALFSNARALQREASCLLTVSDFIYDRGQHLSADARQNAFSGMIHLALESAVASLA
jgi:purine-nucleoside phosphorylase